MATLALAVVGSAVGGALFPGTATLLGATITGAGVGAQLGALAGSVVDNALLAGRSKGVQGPRLSDLHVTSSTEGAPIPRLYGRARLGGQVIWATPFVEEVVSGSSGGGKGLGSIGGSSASTSYRYYGNFAVALCEGEISGIGRVWADGAEIDRSLVAHRVYPGSETQAPDSLIAAVEGSDSAPAYRGLAYVVFEHLPLADYGNRIPQLSFEVYRAVEPFAEAIRGVVLIPGSGEFVYAPEPVTRRFGVASSEAENTHTRLGGTDWAVALDQLKEALPNAQSVSLIVSWFGTDLRAQHCEVKPGVESAAKTTSPLSWGVAGVARDGAYVVSQRDGRAAYGGTPSDNSVIAAIADLKERGHEVTLTPFILMDVEEGNSLANPYGGTGQPAYPWRGRITIDPAPGVSGSPDKTAAAAQIAAFVGTASQSDFSLTEGAVVYSGPDQGDAVSVAPFPKSRLLALRWPPRASAGETGASAPVERAAPPSTQLFERALAHVLEMEGGYSDDPYDPGGPTNKGITLKVYAEWKGVAADDALTAQLRRIPDADVRAIYGERYWRPAGCGELVAPLAFFHFDTAVNHGVTGAIRLLQKACGTDADGEIGPLTRAAVAAMPVERLLQDYAEVRRARYRALPHFWRFGRGWLRRVDVTLARALQEAAAQPAAARLEPSAQTYSAAKGAVPMSDASADATQTASTPEPAPTKWWGSSLTIWGALITALSTVLPALGPILGIDITSDLVRELGTQLVTTAQAIGGLIGTILTIYGRMRATGPLERRDVSMKL
jgi:lysozyme family protein